MRIAKRVSEPEDEVPATLRASEEMVSDAELGEELMSRLPVSQAIAVSEEGEELGSFRVGAALVEAASVG